MRSYALEPSLLQRKTTSSYAQSPVPEEHAALQESGKPLDPATRAVMESRLGHDFSRVRVHADSKAAESAMALKARAYTIGQHIVLGQGQPSFESTAGQRLLAHELAHVVQQSRGGPVPAVDPSAPHERDAAAVASAVAAGQSRVQVSSSTGVGLARNGDEDVPLPDLPDKNPEGDPRYIDNLFDNVVWQFGTNGAFRFEWEQDGKRKALAVAQTDLDQDESHVLAGLSKVHDSKAEALKTVALYKKATPSFEFYSYYRSPDGVILPTVFSLQSTPRFHSTWPGLKRNAAAKADDIREGLHPLANAINPIPGTQTDEHGHLGVSGNPLDWMGFFKLNRLEDIKNARRTRLHSGGGVKYKVVGPTHKLEGTCVYVLKDAQGTVLYVGKGDVLDRLRKHVKDINKTQWVGEIDMVEVHGTSLTNSQALALETDLIGQLKPLYNVDMNPLLSMFGDALELSRNLPKAQKILKLRIEWGH